MALGGAVVARPKQDARWAFAAMAVLLLALPALFAAARGFLQEWR